MPLLVFVILFSSTEQYVGRNKFVTSFGKCLQCHFIITSNHLVFFCDAPINPIWLYPNTELCADIPFMKYNLRSMPFDSSSSSVSRPASSNCVGNFGILRHLIDVAWKLLRTHLGYISCPLATVVKVIGLLKIWNGRWREFFLPFLTFGFSSHTRTKSTSFLLPFVASALRHRVKLNAQKGANIVEWSQLAYNFHPLEVNTFFPHRPRGSWG